MSNKSSFSQIFWFIPWSIHRVRIWLDAKRFFLEEGEEGEVSIDIEIREMKKKQMSTLLSPFNEILRMVDIILINFKRLVVIERVERIELEEKIEICEFVGLNNWFSPLFSWREILFCIPNFNPLFPNLLDIFPGQYIGSGYGWMQRVFSWRWVRWVSMLGFLSWRKFRSRFRYRLHLVVDEDVLFEVFGGWIRGWKLRKLRKLSKEREGEEWMGRIFYSRYPTLSNWMIDFLFYFLEDKTRFCISIPNTLFFPKSPQNIPCRVGIWFIKSLDLKLSLVGKGVLGWWLRKSKFRG